MTQDAAQDILRDAANTSSPNQITTDPSVNPISNTPNTSVTSTEGPAAIIAKAASDTKLASENGAETVSEVDFIEAALKPSGAGYGVAQRPEAKIIITEESPDVVVAAIAPEATADDGVEVEQQATRAPDFDQTSDQTSEQTAEQISGQAAELEAVAQLAEAELAANGLDENQPQEASSPTPTDEPITALENSGANGLELAAISVKPQREPSTAAADTANLAPKVSQVSELEGDPDTNSNSDSELHNDHKKTFIQQQLAKHQDRQKGNDHTDNGHVNDDDDQETLEEREQREREEKLESYKQFLAQQESEQKIDYSQVRVRIEANALPSKMYFLMNALSAIIASYGLVANSPAVVIGAMLVAMMLGPITGVALAIIDYRMPLLRKSLFTVAAGGALVVTIGFIVGLLHQGQPLTNEILSRTQPTSMDLMIALAGGTAGAYAMISPHLSVAVVGVAVATALVPPLAASGILLSNGEISLGLGALLLAITNIIAIQFTNALVLWFTGFRRLVDDDYKSGTYLTFIRRNAVTLLLLIGLGIYLTLNLNRIAKQQQFETNVKTAINDYFIDKGNVLTNTQFDKYDGYQTIRAVIRGETVPSSYDVRQIESVISKDINDHFPKYLPVKLQLRYLPIKVIEANPLITEKLDETDAAILNN